MQYNISVRKKDRGYQIIVSYKDGYRWRQKSKQGFRTQREAKEYGHVILKELDKTALLTKDTELKALKISELKNQLHPAGVIEEVMTSMLVNVKGKLLSLPNKLAPAVIACDNLGEIQDIILTGISDTLTELSEYSPEMFKSKNYIEIISW